MANEKRLIDANAFIKHFERAKEIAKVIPGELGNIFCGLYEECIEEIKKQPTVDAVEVVHGRWIGENCSVCGGDAWYYDYEQTVWTSPYCPNCGAKMDGDGNG